jgi:hypothetical protein
MMFARAFSSVPLPRSTIRELSATIAVTEASAMTDPMGSRMDPHEVRRFGPEPALQVIGPRPVGAPLLTRLTARVLASRYDQMLAVGMSVPAGSALEVHARRLTTIAEREAIARSFRRSLREAGTPPSAWTARSWIHRPNVLAAEELIDTVTLWMHSPRPVNPRGMARLRLLLTDGTGPLYAPRSGGLGARLHAALAVL